MMKRKARPDPVTLEIYRALYTSVAEEMGVSLRRTAFSPNIKERRDYSCAVFDAEGRVIAQGDHMPVHLGTGVGGWGKTRARVCRHHDQILQRDQES
jgi:N-methylhydantoinase B/oxoprolinase/acetone carboxylase alpha subunit